MNEEDNLSEEGLEDPYEKELREAKEEENQRNQRDYEENKYRNRELQRRQEERKRQQLDIPGLFEARSGLRTTAALGTEIFLNTLVDPFFEPGTQVAAGTAINWLAQRIRGGELSKGELVAAGLASLIPGGAQGRAITQFAKGSAKGALSGAIETAGMVGIDEGRLPTKEELAAGLGIGAAFGGALSTPQATKALQDLRGRIAGQYTPITAYAMSPKKGSRKNIPSNPEERAALEAQGQKNVFKSFQEDPRLGESDEALTAQYRALDAKYDGQTLGDTVDEGLTNAQKREIYGRKLESTDLDVIIQEEALRGNTIPPEKAQEYVDLVNETRIGKKDRNNPTKRLKRNQKGYIGTMVYLNEVSLGVNPNSLGNTADVINHISKEIGTDPIGLKRIIEGQGGEISFQTEGMKKPVKIRSLTDLKKAYYLRLARYKDIPAFEKGHVFAANNIIEDRNISSLTDFYNNLEPEISRSIREQVDDETIKELIAAKGKLKNDDFFRSVVDGNRKRQNNQEPDKILADLLGTQYGLRESFLSFVFPERSLSNTIPIESKAAFAELYRKELLARIKDLKSQLTGQSSFGLDTIDKMKIDVAKSVAKGMKDNKLLNAIILVDDKINKRPMTEKGEALPTRDDPVKTDDDGVIREDTPD